jgi:diguanylate cyclase (GGDEF)-like protein/PAS domain S-box-containing protein
MQKSSIALLSGSEMPKIWLTMVLDSCNILLYLVTGIIFWQWFRRFNPEFTMSPVRIFSMLLFLSIALGVLTLLSSGPDDPWIYWVLKILPGTIGVVVAAALGTRIFSRSSQEEVCDVIPCQSSFIPAQVPSETHLGESVSSVFSDYPCVISCVDAHPERQLAMQVCQNLHTRLQEKNAEFEGIFQAFPDLFLLVDHEGTILDYRGEQRCNVHISPTAIGQQKIQELLPSPVASQYEQAIRLVANQQWMTTIEYEIGGSAGEQTYEARLIPFCDQKIMMLIRNTTEKKQAQSALCQSYKELSDLKYALDQSAIIAVTDRKGTITYVNDKFCQISGYSREELIGQNHRILKSDEHSREFFRTLWSTIAQGKIWRGEIKNKTKDGHDYWVDTTIVPLLDPQGKPFEYLSIRTDISDRKQTEKAMGQQQKRLSILHQIDRAILAAEEPEAIAEVTVKRLRPLLPCQRVSVISFNLNTGEAIVLAIDADRESCILAGNRLPLMNQDGFANPDQLTNGVLVVKDILELANLTPVQESLKAEGLRSCVCIPLKSRNLLLGSLNLWSDRPGDFSDAQIAIAQEVADSLAIAIQQARLRQTVQSYAQELEQRVADRTAELLKVNEKLRQEIEQRQQIEGQLYHEKEVAQVTLNSIGDAVITTDLNGIIQSLNPQAETLTGWRQSEAQGQPLKRVLQLFNAITGDPVENFLDRSNTSRLSAFSHHTLIRNRDSEEFMVEPSVAFIRMSSGEIIGIVVICRDVTENRKLAAQLSWEASHDPLTNLINRREFKRLLSELMEEKSTTESEHSLCYLDLDQFKIVNDTCGHAAGDELLRQITTLLQSRIRKTDLLARLGGDEFALLLYECPLKQARQVAEDLRQLVQDFRFVWQDKTFSIGVSIGLVKLDPIVTSLADVMSAADSAMYAAKDAGRNRIHVYQANDQELAQRQGDMQWVSRLVKALEEDRFCLYSQAIAPAQTDSGKADHYEILIRMTDENGALIPPGMFIPAAERYNLISKIDRWVIRNLFSYLSTHLHHSSCGNKMVPDTLLSHQAKTVSPSSIYTVNLSGASFNDEQFLSFLQEQFAHYQITPQMICFEVTETFAISNLNKAIQFIHALKHIGCSFALDDFGSGMSSLTYLKNLPVDYVKIDGYFVKNILEDPVNAAMIEAINKLTHAMGLETIAEFVENEQILHKLQELGVDYVQGYGIAKPSPLGGNLINMSIAKQKPKLSRQAQAG